MNQLGTMVAPLVPALEDEFFGGGYFALLRRTIDHNILGSERAEN